MHEVKKIHTQGKNTIHKRPTTASSSAILGRTKMLNCSLLPILFVLARIISTDCSEVLNVK